MFFAVIVAVLVGIAVGYFFGRTKKEGRFELANQQKLDLEQQLKDEKARADELRKDFQADHDKVIGLTSDKTHLEKRVDELNAQLTDATNRLQQKDVELSNLKEETARQTENLNAQEKRVKELNSQLTKADDLIRQKDAELNRLKEESVRQVENLNAQEKRINDTTKHYEELRHTTEAAFKNLSNEILEEKRKQLQEGGVKSVQEAINPFKQSLEEFKVRVEAVDKAGSERVSKLEGVISTLTSQTTKVSNEANSLADAIRGGKTQATGQWGEIQLLNVLQLAGLTEGIDYTYQETFASEGSARKDLRTDVMLKLPHERWVVIDSKTTMAAYLDYVKEGDAHSEDVLKRLTESIKSHVLEMEKANYSKNIAKTTGRVVLNTMLMYIPIEEVYLYAMNAKVEGEKPLWDWAQKKGVTLVNSATIIPLAHILADFWEQKRAEKNASEMKKSADKLIEQFAQFIVGKDGFASLGDSLKKVVMAYNTSLGRLATGKGNVLKILKDLSKKGVKIEKLPQEESAREHQVDEEIQASPLNPEVIDS